MSNLSSAIFYFSIIVSTTLCADLSNRIDHKIWRKFFKYLTLLIPSIVAGIRIDVGTDYSLYNRAFKEIIINKTSRYEDFEIGYRLLNKIIYSIGGNFHLVMFIMSFFTILFIYNGLINENKNIALTHGIMVYMFLFYQTSLNIVRQSLAISICLYACTCLNRGKKYRYFLYVLLASTFHRSALICLSFIVLKPIFQNKDKKILKTVIFLTLLILVFKRDILGEIVFHIFDSNYYSGYFLRETAVGGNIIFYIAKILPIILCCIIVYNYIKHNKNLIMYYNFILCGYILGALGCFTLTQVQRIAYYFTYLIILLLPFVIRIVSKRKFVVVKVLLLGFIVFNWYFDYFYRGYSQTIPYKSIFYEVYIS
ncbi:MAG: EpsG family protein [Clostridium butyricum]|nr:EpsG family protein [Clostridium butyricum]MDU5820991.1 EpsG family protein [Clostridium butyricum]